MMSCLPISSVLAFALAGLPSSSVAGEATFLGVSVHDGQARVAVPMQPDEADAWTAAAEADGEAPARLESLRPNALVFPGTTTAPGDFVGYETESDAAGKHWVMVFEAAGVSASEGLAVHGDVTNPTLAAVAPIKLSSEAGQLHLEAVRTVLDETLTRGARRRLGSKVLSKRRVSLIEGEFPAGGTVLVAVNVPMRGHGTVISGMFTLTADGEVATVIHAPQLRREAFAPVGVGDVDGDGFDDVMFRATTRTLTEDGVPPADCEADPGLDACIDTAKTHLTRWDADPDQPQPQTAALTARG